MRIYVVHIPDRDGDAGPIEAFVSESGGRAGLDSYVDMETRLLVDHPEYVFEHVKTDTDTHQGEKNGEVRPVAAANHSVKLLSKTIHYLHYRDAAIPDHRCLTFRLYEVILTGSPLEALAAQA